MEIQEVGTRVPILTDIPKDSPQIQDVIKMSAAIIEAAKEDRLVSVVCKDDEGKQAVILCAMYPGKDTNVANYVPLARQFDADFGNWIELYPPSCAVQAAA